MHMYEIYKYRFGPRLTSVLTLRNTQLLEAL